MQLLSSPALAKTGKIVAETAVIRDVPLLARLENHYRVNKICFHAFSGVLSDASWEICAGKDVFFRNILCFPCTRDFAFNLQKALKFRIKEPLS